MLDAESPRALKGVQYPFVAGESRDHGTWKCVLWRQLISRNGGYGEQFSERWIVLLFSVRAGKQKDA